MSDVSPSHQFDFEEDEAHDHVADQPPPLDASMVDTTHVDACMEHSEDDDDLGNEGLVDMITFLRLQSRFEALSNSHETLNQNVTMLTELIKKFRSSMQPPHAMANAPMPRASASPSSLPNVLGNANMPRATASPSHAPILDTHLDIPTKDTTELLKNLKPPVFKGEDRERNKDNEQQHSFDTIKQALATAPILAIVDPTKPFVVEIDASDKAIGAVLLREDRPIAFESKKLDKAQQNYSVYERELYAIIYGLKKWRHYLYGAQFDIVFDQESIQWFTQQTDLKSRKARWAEILQEYDARLRYRKGRYNVVANTLSKMPEINSLAFTEIKSDFLDSLKGLCELAESYSKVWSHVKTRDPSHSNAASASSSSTHSSPSCDELQRWKNFSIDDGYLLHKGRICVPTDKDIRRQILYECHDSPSAGHPGIRKTYALVRR
ncbi:hypothetical protein L7F22_036056 [Adiantum nelumboides]|nr:hypothetical protein [Adiantum nelumboides]